MENIEQLALDNAIAEAAKVSEMRAEVAAYDAAHPVERPVRIITPDILMQAGLTNGMTPDQCDSRIEAVFTARGE